MLICFFLVWSLVPSINSDILLGRCAARAADSENGKMAATKRDLNREDTLEQYRKGLLNYF